MLRVICDIDFPTPPNIAVIPVKKLIENDIDQPFIDNEVFYQRYTFEYKARLIDVSSLPSKGNPTYSSVFLQPKPGTDTCVCDTPYSPDDPSRSALMHFCPRPSCRRFYHQRCIGPQIKDTAEHHLHLLASSPDSDETLVLEDLVQSSEPPKKKRRGRPSNSKAQNPPPRSVEEVLQTVPSDLLLIAQQPIVRGGSFYAGGVSGNVSAVVYARRIVYDALRGTVVPEGWEAELNVQKSVYTRKTEKAPAFLCPKCEGAI